MITMSFFLCGFSPNNCILRISNYNAIMTVMMTVMIIYDGDMLLMIAMLMVMDIYNSL